MNRWLRRLLIFLVVFTVFLCALLSSSSSQRTRSPQRSPWSLVENKVETSRTADEAADIDFSPSEHDDRTRVAVDAAALDLESLMSRTDHRGRTDHRDWEYAASTQKDDDGTDDDRRQGEMEGVAANSYSDSDAAEKNAGLETSARGAGSSLSLSFIGNASRCLQSNGCRMCSDFQLDNTELHVPRYCSQYLSQHVLFGLITGSFEQFFRMDVGFCTWMAHVPPRNLFVFTDRANESGKLRPGTWLEPQLPSKVRFSRAQLKAKGYTIFWIRAQFRFIQAIQLLGRKARSGEPVAEVHWVVVVDDDTFVDVRALALMLHRYDLRSLRGMATAAVAVAGEEADGGTALNPNHSLLFSREELMSKANLSDLRQLTFVSANRDKFRATYVGDKGWGGAGHLFNFAAATRFAERAAEECVDRYMVRRFLASDETLKRCLPRLGISVVNERLLSHCQANFLKKRLMRGDHVSSHAKRDFVPPRGLAMWRLRLYYQAVYHRNATAYELLQTVGACAFGYSCKIRGCDAEHDRQALRLYMNLSHNDSFVPLL